MFIYIEVVFIINPLFQALRIYILSSFILNKLFIVFSNYIFIIKKVKCNNLKVEFFLKKYKNIYNIFNIGNN